MNIDQRMPRPVVHLELHTGDQEAASAFYARLLRWRTELVEARCGSYFALELGGGLGGGIVECATKRPLWLPYVEVDRIDEQTERAGSARGCFWSRAKGRPAGVALFQRPKQGRLLSGRRSDDREPRSGSNNGPQRGDPARAGAAAGSARR
jgi:predicted enzyme related to lactoylglutathione lyase